MFEKAEADYRALSEKKRIIENDKAKIHKVRAPSSLPAALPNAISLTPYS